MRTCPQCWEGDGLDWQCYAYLSPVLGRRRTGLAVLCVPVPSAGKETDWIGSVMRTCPQCWEGDGLDWQCYAYLSPVLGRRRTGLAALRVPVPSAGKETDWIGSVMRTCPQCWEGDGLDWQRYAYLSPSAGKETDWALMRSQVSKTLDMEVVMPVFVVCPTIWTMCLDFRLPGLVTTTPSLGCVPGRQNKGNYQTNYSQQIWKSEQPNVVTAGVIPRALHSSSTVCPAALRMAPDTPVKMKTMHRSTNQMPISRS